MKSIEIKKYNPEEGSMESLACHKIETINWSEYPYKPDVTFHIGYSATHIHLLYRVEERHVKAVNMEDQGSVWCDSCVEFFVKLPDSEYYYNFEFNCIGTMLGARRVSKSEFERLSAEELESVERVSSLPHEVVDRESEGEAWSLQVAIPFSILGCEEAPTRLLANLYKCGDETNEPHFVSWSPIGVESPNFHRPDYFGELILV